MTSNPILISIIIPAYNEQDYLDDCLRSLEDNSLSGCEIIVVDNNSTDNTGNICKNHTVTPLKSIKPGAAATRNAGANHAQGEYCYFLDADCRVTKSHLPTLIQYLRKNPKLDVLAGPYIYDQDGNIPLLITKKYHYFSWYFRLIHMFCGIQSFSAGNVVIRKAVFDMVGGFNEDFTNQSLPYPEDLELAIRLSKKGISIRFEPGFCVSSSMRRVKAYPHHTLIRAFSTMSLLVKYALKKNV